jgi:Lipase (class 3)
MSPDIPYSAAQDDLFNPGRRDGFFSPKPQSDAALCAEMARLAYCRMEPDFGFDRERIQEILKRVDFTNCHFFESLGTARGEGVHGFLALRENDKLALAAFRGTDAKDIKDVAYDVDFRLVQWPKGGEVHEGFAHALGKLQSTLEPALKAVEAYRMLVTGHSLGAAMATLQASLYTPDSLYTFGCPRVGDAEFVATLGDTKSYRYVDCCDLVARIPPEIGYRHVGELYYIDRSRQVRFAPQTPWVWWDRFRAQAEYLAREALKPSNVRIRSLADHAPINYVWPVKASQP